MQMRTTLRVVWAHLLLLMTISACRTTNQTESALKWGYLGNISPQSLIRQPSGTFIKVCGPYSVQTSWAIDVWAAAINRRLNVVQSCDNPSVVTQSAVLDPLLQDECVKRGNTAGLFANPYSQPMRIAMCNTNAVDSRDLQAAILHEVGHLWGMCDQYKIQDGLKTCAYTTEPVEGSVMNVNPPLNLTSDDIEGIRKLADMFPDSASSIVTPAAALPANDQLYSINTPTMGSNFQKLYLSEMVGNSMLEIQLKNSSINQTWAIERSDLEFYFYIKSKEKRCIDINPNVPQMSVVLQKCGNYLGQKWLFEQTTIPSYYRLKTLFTGLHQCLTPSGTLLAMQPCDPNNSTQLWQAYQQ